MNPLPLVSPASAAASAPTSSVCLDRPIDSLAAFFDDEAGARHAMRRLVERPGLPWAHLSLLEPADGTWLAFLRRVHAAPLDDADPPWRRDPWLLALLGGIAGGLVATAALLRSPAGLDIAQAALLYALGSIAGAGLGAGLARISGWLPPYDRFELVLRRRLAAGQWAIRLRAIPWARQAEVVAWLRELNVHWYAVSSHLPRV